MKNVIVGLMVFSSFSAFGIHLRLDINAPTCKVTSLKIPHFPSAAERDSLKQDVIKNLEAKGYDFSDLNQNDEGLSVSIKLLAHEPRTRYYDFDARYNIPEKIKRGIIDLTNLANKKQNISEGRRVFVISKGDTNSMNRSQFYTDRFSTGYSDGVGNFYYYRGRSLLVPEYGKPLIKAQSRAIEWAIEAAPYCYSRYYGLRE